MRMVAFYIICFLFCSSITYGSMKPDCQYRGRGEVYKFDGTHLMSESFNLDLERYPVGPGEYLFKEVKTFFDGEKRELYFSMGWFKGPFHFDDGKGRLVEGMCIDFGYCAGKNEFPGFKGTFVTHFNEREILTTTTTSDRLIFESVKPIGNVTCGF